ncbi:MAG TPA: V-type ATPase 116kDa subunit family protein [bacterium]|nr:V-type ATPase 116kDa subunit family protein [bacterium]
MIVDMSRVIVLGPKRLLGSVIEEVQRIGALHVDHIESEEAPVSPVQLSEEETRALAALERAATRADGLLTLLPAGAAPAGGAEVPVPVDASVDALEAQVVEVEQRVRALTRTRLELEEELSLIASYEGAVRALSPLLNALAGSRSLESIGFLLNTKDLTAVTAIRNELVKATGGRVEVISRIVDENRIGAVVAFRRADADVVRPVLSRAGVSELRLPARFAGDHPADTVAMMERRKAEIPGEIERIDREVAAIAAAERPRVAAVRAVLADRLAQMKVVPSLAQSRYTFIMHGWSPTRSVSEIRGRLRQRFGADIVVYDAPADPHHEPGRVPVMLDNPGIVRPFQRMLALFRPPRYGNLDPTTFVAFFFPIFTGIVIGDVAYGALLFALGWWMRGKARAGEAWQIKLGSIDLGIRLAPPVLADASWIIRVIGAWSMIFGALYLELFGNLLEHQMGWHPLFNRVELTTAFLGLVIALGLTQVTLGYVLHLVQAVRHRHPLGVIESLAMICGVVGLLAVLGAMGNQFPQAVFTPGLILLGAFLVLFFVGVVLSRSALMWLLEAISGMGNVLSYARLFGVGLAAAVLANVANELGGSVGPVWVGILIGILIQLVFFIFTLPGHVIQPARLNWVEFLTKFKYHDETGNSYRPFQKTGGD